MTREEKRAEWAGVLGVWRESGLSAAAFCREYGVKSWQFHYWRRRLTGPDASAESGSFVALRFSDEAGDAGEAPVSGGVGVRVRGGLTLELRGVRVALAADFDERALARVLRVLGAMPCAGGADGC